MNSKVLSLIKPFDGGGWKYHMFFKIYNKCSQKHSVYMLGSLYFRHIPHSVYEGLSACSSHLKNFRFYAALKDFMLPVCLDLSN